MLKYSFVGVVTSCSVVHTSLKAILKLNHLFHSFLTPTNSTQRYANNKSKIKSLKSNRSKSHAQNKNAMPNMSTVLYLHVYSPPIS
jgi:hypothetical protein